jgi:hypothetical protein
MGIRSGLRGGDGRGLLIEVPEEIIERSVYFYVHVDGCMNFDGIEFHVNASRQKTDTSKQEKATKHGHMV